MMFCDRCDALHQPHPDWPTCPLCPECLIGLRRAEATDTATRMITAREIEAAWRAHILRLVA